MDYINVYANAKVNLALDVLGKRDDGYHDMKMVMQTVSLRDGLCIRKTFLRQIKIVSNIKWLPTDERNLVHKACTALFERCKPDYGVLIEINKRIPVAAGLAGGSADCAAALVGLRRLFKLNITNHELKEMGKKLGADVPYCLMRGTALAEGIGDRLTKLSACPDAYLVLAKPNVSVSTATVFKQFDNGAVTSRPNIDALTACLRQQNIEGVSQAMGNVLESVTAAQYPIISKLKEIMMLNGAMGAVMSGSGPTVFGMFKNKQQAYNCFKNIKTQMPLRNIYLTNIYNPGRNELYER